MPPALKHRILNDNNCLILSTLDSKLLICTVSRFASPLTMVDSSFPLPFCRGGILSFLTDFAGSSVNVRAFCNTGLRAYSFHCHFWFLCSHSSVICLHLRDFIRSFDIVKLLMEIISCVFVAFSSSESLYSSADAKDSLFDSLLESDKSSIPSLFGGLWLSASRTMACCIEFIDCVTHNMLSFSFRSVDANVSLGFAEVAREVRKCYDS